MSVNIQQAKPGSTSLKRTFMLFGLYLKSLWHRLYYDLSKEIVVLLCSAVLFGLFYYVFNDFLNSKVASLSSELQYTFGQYLTGFLLFATTLACSKKLALVVKAKHSSSSETSFEDFALVRGELSKTVSQLKILRSGTIILTHFSLAWMIATKALVLFPNPVNLFLILTLPFVSWVLTRFIQFSPQEAPEDQAVLNNGLNLTQHKALINWRMLHLLHRNKLARFCMVLGSILTCSSMLAFSSSHPDLLNFIILYISGFCFAAAIALQVAEDLPFSWAEKSFGVHHDAFVSALDGLSRRLSLLVFSLSLSCLFFGQYFSDKSLPMLSTATLAIIATVPILMIPSFCFQIDARRPIIPIMSVLLVGLFVATAIFAHPLAVLLLPVATYYGKQNQVGRYYRA